jgi:hypothetical protein
MIRSVVGSSSATRIRIRPSFIQHALRRQLRPFRCVTSIRSQAFTPSQAGKGEFSNSLFRKALSRLNDHLQTGDGFGGHRLRARQQFGGAVQNLLPAGLFQPADEFRQPRDADAAATGFEFVRDAVEAVGVSLVDRGLQQVELKRRIAHKVMDQNDKILLHDIPQFGDDFIIDQQQLVEIGVAHADYSLVALV